MIFNKGYITASSDTLAHSLSIPQEADSIRSYHTAASLGSATPTTEKVIPIMFTFFTADSNTSFAGGGPFYFMLDSVGGSADSNTAEFISRAAIISANLISHLNTHFAPANISFVFADKEGELFLNGSPNSYPGNSIFESVKDPSSGDTLEFTHREHGIRCSDTTKEGVTIKGVSKSMLNNLTDNSQLPQLDTDNVLNIFIVTGLNNTPLRGNTIHPLSEGPHPGSSDPFVGYLPYYSLSDEHQALLEVDYSVVGITPPVLNPSEYRHQILINLVGSMLGLLPTHINDAGLTPIERCLTSSSGCMLFEGGRGDCMETIPTYIDKGHKNPWFDIIYDTHDNASKCSDIEVAPATYVSGDNLMTLRVDKLRSILSPEQINFIRGGFEIHNSIWSMFAATSSEYTPSTIYDPCDRSISRSIGSRSVARSVVAAGSVVVTGGSSRMLDLSEDAYNIISTINKVNLLCNNILNN